MIEDVIVTKLGLKIRVVELLTQILTHKHLITFPLLH